MSKKALSTYNQAAESVWPGLTLIKEHIEALEQVRAAGKKGLPPREIKRGLGEAFLALANSRKGPTAFSDEVCAAMSGDMDRRADIQEENALIRLVQDTDTYHEAYHLTRLGKRLMDTTNRLTVVPLLPVHTQHTTLRGREAAIGRPMPRENPSTPCPDCGAMPAELHRDGCEVERCPACGMQRLSCCCTDSERNTNRMPWTGEWPGKAECREFGMYAKFVLGKGWVGCQPDDPDATEDLNRLFVECRWDRKKRRFLR